MADDQKTSVPDRKSVAGGFTATTRDEDIAVAIEWVAAMPLAECAQHLERGNVKQAQAKLQEITEALAVILRAVRGHSTA